MSPNPNYIAGRKFEYDRLTHYKKLGYIALRTAGSHGPYDIVAIHPSGSMLLIQCKRVTTQAQADKLKSDFLLNPPMSPKWRAGPTQVLEVKIKGNNEVQTTYY